MPRYLITTGSSKTGAATIVALKNLGVSAADIVAGSRDPARSEAQLKALGAGHVIAFDHEDEAVIEKALVGIDAVLVSVGATLRIAPVYSRVERIASKSGSSVKSIVGIGAVLNGRDDAALASAGDVAKDFAAAHKAITSSKLDSAIVAPNWFFENWKLPSTWAQLQAGTVYGSSADGKVAYIAAQDIGNVAAVVLTNTHKYNGQVLEITGPQALTEGEAAAIVAKIALGKADGAQYVSVPEADFRQALTDAGLPAGWVDYLYELETIKAAGFASAVTTLVKDVTGRDPVSAEAWAKQLAAELASAK